MSPVITKPIAVVVIPTYNEADNISRLLPRLFSQIFPIINNWTLEVVIVDGHSSDKTSDIVRNFALDNRAIHLIDEKVKNGIGSAYMEGFRFAINQIGASVIIEIDADFQHPLENIPLLLEKIDEGYDYVVGSRVIQGGSESKNRNFFRSFLTRVGGIVARIILFFPGKYFSLVTDPTTGLKATRVRGVLDQLNLNTEHLYSKKFGYKIQLLYETLATGAHYTEIPLLFENRTAGVSKFEAGTVFDILFTCFKVRLSRVFSEI